MVGPGGLGWVRLLSLVFWVGVVWLPLAWFGCFGWRISVAVAWVGFVWFALIWLGSVDWGDLAGSAWLFWLLGLVWFRLIWLAQLFGLYWLF